MKKLSVIVVGAGSRGRGYTDLMTESDRLLHENWETSLEAAEQASEKHLGKINPSEPLTFGELPSMEFLTTK